MSAFWRDPAGFTIGNESKTAPVAPPDMARFRTTGQKLQISFSGQPYKDLALTAQDIPIDGAFPDGISTELQARGSSTTFKRVTYSGTSGSNVTLGGVLTIDAATSMDRSIVLSSVFSAPQTTMALSQYQSIATPILLLFDRARGTAGAGAQNLIDNDPVGEVRFRGQVSGAMANLGYVRTSWNLNDGGYVELGTGTAPAKDGPGARLIVTQNIGSGFFTNSGAVPFLVDNTANVRVGLGSLPTTATAGFLWVPQATGLMTAAPSPVHPGWKPLAFIGTNLYTHDGSTWTQISGSSNQMSTWLWSSSLSGAVAAGVVAIDNNDPSLATAVRIAEASDTSTDVSAILQALIPGDGIYIQNTADNTKWVRYTIAGPLVDEGTWRTVPVDVADYGGTDLNDAQVNITFVRGGGGGGGGANPEGVASEIQYRKTATEFGAVVNSSVMGADVKFGGSFVVSNETPTVAASKGFFINPTGMYLSTLMGQSSDTFDPILIDIQRSSGVGGAATDTVKNQYIGRILFSRYLTTPTPNFPTVAYLHAVWDGEGAADLGGVASFGAGTYGTGGSQVVVQHKNATSSTVGIFANSTTWFQVSTDGFRFSSGTTGSIYYRDPSSYFVSLDIDADPTGGTDLGKVLTVTDVGGGVFLPRWQPPDSASVRLDQVADPTGNKFFTMGDHQIGFHFAGTQSEECFAIASMEPVTPGAAGALLLLRTAGATTEKSPLRIETRNAFALSVTATGSVAIGSETVTSAHKVGIANPNSTIGSLIIQESIPASGGARNAVTLSLSDNTTTAHSGYYGINIGYSKTAAQASAPAFLLHINPSSIGESLSELTSINLRAPAVMPGKTLTTWTGIKIVNVAAGGATTNKYAIATEGGAGNVGLGTLTPAAQLHVVGATQTNLIDGQVVSIYKTSETEPAQLDFYRLKISGPLIHGDYVGRIMFYGPGLQKAGYLHCGYSTDYGAGWGVVLGAGDVGAPKARLEMLQLDGGGGAVSMVSGGVGSTFFQVHTAGFQFSHGATGSLYYKDASNWFVPLLINTNATFYLKSTGTLPDWAPLLAADLTGVLAVANGGTGSGAPPTAGQILRAESATSYLPATLAQGTGIGISNISGTITITNLSPGTGGSPPGTAVGTETPLQYRLGPSTFGGITGSSVSGSTITLGGNLNVIDTGGHELYFQRTTLPSAGSVLLGQVAFRDPSTDSGTAKHVLRSYWLNDGYGSLYTFEMWASDTRHVYITQVATALEFDGHTVSCQAGGVGVSTGIAGGLYYKDSLGFFATVPILGSSGKWLKSNGTIPSWAVFDASDIATGIVPIARGGTGLSTPPGGGQFLIGNGSVYGLGTITNGGGISINYTGGNIQLTATGGSVNDSLDTILDPLANSELVMGSTQVRFRWNGAMPASGMLIDSTSNSAAQGILLHIRNTYTDDNAARLLVCQINNAVDFPLCVSHIGAVGMGGSPNPATPIIDTFRCQIFSPGSNRNALYCSGNVEFVIPGMEDNSIYYRASSKLAGIPASTTAGRVLMTDGSTWAARSITVVGGSITYTGGVLQITVSGGPGGSPAGYTGQIQFNNGGAFGGVGDASGTPGSFEVSPSAGAPSLILAGGYFQIVPSISGTFPTRFVNQDQEFFISATTAAPTRFVMRRYSNNPSDGSANDGRWGGYIRFDKGRGTASLPSDVVSGDQIGMISWWGRISGALAQMGYIAAYFNSGGVLRLAAKSAGYAYIDIREGTVPATDNAISLYAGNETHFVQVQNAGIRMSVGAHGSLLWQDSTGGTLLVAGLPISTNNTHFLRSDGAKPYWGAAPGGSGASPAGLANELQYKVDASTFGAVSHSFASGANVTLEEWTDTNTIGSTLTLQKRGAGGGAMTNNAGSHITGQLLFKAQPTGFGAMEDFGRLEALWAPGDIRAVRLMQGVTGTHRVISLKNTGEIDIEIASGINTSEIVLTPTVITISPASAGGGGVVVTGGTNRGAYFRNNSGYMATTAAPTTAGQVMMYDSAASQWRVGTLIGTPSVTIDNSVQGQLTFTATGGGVSGLTTGTVLYAPSSTSVGSISSSSVSGANVTFGGTVQAVGLISACTASDGTNIFQADHHTLNYASATSAGWGHRTIWTLKSSNTQYRPAGAMDVRWQTATDSTRSTVMSLRTMVKGVLFPTSGGHEYRERLLLGGYKDLTNATLATLFSVTFASADCMGGGGQIRMIIGIKDATTKIAFCRRIVNFLITHNGNTALMGIDFRSDSGTQSELNANDGTQWFNQFYHTYNFVTEVPLATNLTAISNISGNVLTYKFRADKNPAMTATPSTLAVWYDIQYSGDFDLTLG